MIVNLRILVAAYVLAAPACAFADATISYRSEGGCAGDFDSVQLKDYYLRADAEQGGGSGSMIYDGAEKLGYFIDHRSRTFMQVEMDEDAVDLQADIMSSLRKQMRNKGGIDPFEMAHSLCPGLADAGNRDRQPDEAIDCGNGTKLGGAPAGANGQAMTHEQLAAAMKNGQMPGMSAESVQMMQKMMEQNIASLPPEQQAQMRSAMANGGMMMPSMPAQGARPAPAPQRIDRDAGDIDVDGITCTRREHLRGDEMLREDCYATTGTLKLGDAESRRVARFSKAIQGWSHSLVPDELRKEADDRVLIRRVCYASGRETGRATLRIDRAPIQAARFEVPAGYAPMDTGLGGPRAQEP